MQRLSYIGFIISASNLHVKKMGARKVPVPCAECVTLCAKP